MRPQDGHRFLLARAPVRRLCQTIRSTAEHLKVERGSQLLDEGLDFGELFLQGVDVVT
jgi:hypothetical protein